MLTRVLPVMFGRPGAVDVLLPEQAEAAWLGLDLMAFLAEQFGHLLHAEPLIDRDFDQLARPFNADDLHRPAAVLIRRHVDERQPEAARGDAVTVEQAGVEREE